MVADLVVPMYYLQAVSIATDKYYGTKLNLLFDMCKGELIYRGAGELIYRGAGELIYRGGLHIQLRRR